MKKRTVTIAIYLIAIASFHLLSGMDDKTDSLKNIIQTTQVDTIKAKALNRLGWVIMYENPDSAKLLSLQALEISEKSKFQAQIAKSYANLGAYYSIKNNFDSALICFSKALSIRMEINDQQGTANSYNDVGQTYLNLANYPMALDHFFKSLKIDEKLGNKRNIADSYSNIGNVYYSGSDFPKSLEYYFKSISLFEELHDDPGRAFFYNNVGNVYYIQNNFEQALKYYFLSNEIDQKSENDIGLAKSDLNIGIIYVLKSDYSQAKSFFLKALRINQKLQDSRGIASVYTNLGMMYTFMYSDDDWNNKPANVNQKSVLLDSALYYQKTSYAINTTLGLTDAIIYNLAGIGETNYLKGNYDQSVKNYDQAIHLAQEIGARQNEYATHLKLSEVFKEWAVKDGNSGMKIKHLLESINHYDASIVLRDSLFNEEKEKEFGRLEAQHEYQILQVKREQEEREQIRIEKEEKSRRNNLQYSGITLGLFLLFGTLFTMARLSLPKWAVEFSVFFPFLIFFEFLLVLTDPLIDKFTNGEPIFTLLANATLAGLILPIHSFFEHRLKKRLFRKSLILDQEEVRGESS